MAAEATTGPKSVQKLDITIEKPIPYSFDLGNLLCNDINALSPSPTPEILSATARDCGQGLVNQILTSCPIQTGPTKGTCIILPQSSSLLPREKPLPKAKAETKWEQFARKKGIKPKSRPNGRVQFNEESGEWVSKWGYQGRKKEHDSNWVVEVDERKEVELKEGETVRGEGRRERKGRVKKNAQRQKANTLGRKKGSAK